uniref:Steroid receptor RNA activator 1 n=1 Tax=Anas platyrhynchos TaxID=8839 RepID=A0A8B9SVS4_ANAPL
MAELYVKPGNKERGWNDPPQFSYGLQAQGAGPRRAPLTRRVPAPGALPGQHPPGPAKPRETPGDGKPRMSGVMTATPAWEGCPEAGPLQGSSWCFQKQVCDDIGRRLTVLEESWAQGNLLVQGEGQGVTEIHRSLMVDYVNEVSQWLVGVKRLIAETRKLPAEEPAAPRDDSTEAQPEQEAP